MIVPNRLHSRSLAQLVLRKTVLPIPYVLSRELADFLIDGKGLLHCPAYS